MNRSSIVFLAVLLITACSPTSIPASTVTQSPPIDTSSPTLTIEPTSTSVTIATESPTSTSFPTDTPVALPSSTMSPTATIRPTLTTDEIFALNQNHEQLSPQEIVENIRNGETLIQAELTDEFLQFYTDVLTVAKYDNPSDSTIYPVQEITQAHLEEYEARTSRNAELIGFEEGLNLYIGEAFVSNIFNSGSYSFAPAGVEVPSDYSENGIQIFKDDPTHRAYGLTIFTMRHPETGNVIKFIGITGAGRDNQLGISGLAPKENIAGVNASNAAYFSMTERFLFDSDIDIRIRNGDQVIFGFGEYGEWQELLSNLGGFFDPIILKMYGGDLESLARAVESGNLNIVPIIPISFLERAAWSENVFDGDIDD